MYNINKKTIIESSELQLSLLTIASSKDSKGGNGSQSKLRWLFIKVVIN